jgi:LmbE family N-acetylglucosaminyl deacetylase
MFGKRILILVPHPDDEIVACAATIERARAGGAEVFTLYLTHGRIAKEAMWPWKRKQYDALVARRRAEAEAVACFLGLSPVGWKMRAARHLLRHMAEARKEIQAAIAARGIDQLWVPAYEGGNPDHDVTNALGQSLKPKLSVLEFAEYNFFGGKAQSQTFPFPNGSEQVIELTEAERAAKKEALALYASEKLNLNYVRADRECYRPLADYDYGQPPHPGKLWYARFQWVPFRHPRVDFTDPAEVSKAIVDFLKQRR